MPHRLPPPTPSQVLDSWVWLAGESMLVDQAPVANASTTGLNCTTKFITLNSSGTYDDDGGYTQEGAAGGVGGAGVRGCLGWPGALGVLACAGVLVCTLQDESFQPQTTHPQAT